MTQVVRPFRPGDERACEQLLRGLPEWFGIESALVDYARATTELPTLMAQQDGENVGFLSLRQHNPSSAEIHCLAVRRDQHGRGWGRRLVEESVRTLVAPTTEFLQVKTLGPSRPDENYAATREFYLRLGFLPLEENQLWGEANPCLILVQSLRHGPLRSPLLALQELYAEVDQSAGSLHEKLSDRLQCRRGCASCCQDDLRVFEIEAENIRRRQRTLLEREAAGPVGGCAFLDAQGACRIYSDRPYVCRTQGLPLRWLDETDRGEVAEFRDICPLNEEEGPPVETLPESDCWTLGPIEDRLAALQAAFGPPGQRVALRSLFRDSKEPPQD